VAGTGRAFFISYFGSYGVPTDIWSTYFSSYTLPTVIVRIVPLLLVGLLISGPTLGQDGSVCPNKTDSALLHCVRNQYSPNGTLGYDEARDVLYGDIDLDGSNELTAVYTGLAITINNPNGDPTGEAFNEGINTEHVVPQSAGMDNEPQTSDMHNLRPTRINVNSARGSLPFDDSPDAQTNDWYAFDTQQSSTPDASDPYPIDAYSERDLNTRFEPREQVKGDVARAVFYVSTVWEAQVDDAILDQHAETLLQWHEADDVTAAERSRSQDIAAAQGNENPFVVDTTLAQRVLDADGGGGSSDPGTIAEARQGGAGTTVSFKGLVTRAKGDFTYVQDESGPTGASGFTIRQTSGSFHDDVADGTIARGDSIEVTGTKSYFSGLQQINGGDLSSYSVFSSGHTLPTPQSVDLQTLRDGGGEDYEAELVTATGIEVVNTADNAFSASTSYDLEGPTQNLSTSPTDPVVFRVPNASDTDLDGVPIPSGTFSFTGVLGQYNGGNAGSDTPDEGYQLLAIDANRALPVELVSFEAARDGARAVLTWQTATETGNAGFAVQRRTKADGWAERGFVQGAGTTTRPQSYRFATDALAGGTHTFRLKQIDADGTAHHSDPRTVMIRGEAGLVLSGANPLQKGQPVAMRVQVENKQFVEVVLYDVLGQRVRTVTTDRATPAQPIRATMSTDGLASGVYFLRAHGSSVEATQRLTVLR